MKIEKRGTNRRWRPGVFSGQENQTRVELWLQKRSSDWFAAMGTSSMYWMAWGEAMGDGGAERRKRTGREEGEGEVERGKAW